MNKFKIIILPFLLLSLVACSSSDNNNKGENIEIAFSLYSTEDDTYSKMYQDWAQEIEEETEGRVTFDSFYSGQLAELNEAYDAVKDKSVDGAILSAAAISGDIPTMGLLEPVGVFQEENKFEDFYKDSQEEMNKIFDNHELQLLFWTPGNALSFNLSSTDEYIKEAEEFSNLKMRTAGQWQAEQIELMGGSPVTMDPSELYLAFQNHTVDGTIQGVTLTEAQKLYEVSQKMVLSDFTNNANIFVINPDVWEEISEEDQKTIQKISEEKGINSYSKGKEIEKSMAKELEEDGADIYELNAEEQDLLKKQLEEVTPEIIKSVDQEGEEFSEILEEYK